MKFAIVALFLFTFTTCATLPELETSSYREKVKECIRGAEPILDDIFDLIEAFEIKNFIKVFTTIELIIDHVKETITKCKLNSVNDIVLERGAFKKNEKDIKRVINVVNTMGLVASHVNNKWKVINLVH
jgi:hypothetical protein